MIIILKPIIVQQRQEAFCDKMITNIGWISTCEENITWNHPTQEDKKIYRFEGMVNASISSIDFVNNHCTGPADCKLSKREII